MFGVSFTELVVIMLVTLVLLGPEKLPEAARTIGKFMAILKRNSDALRREFYNTVYNPAEDIKNRVNTASRELISMSGLNPADMNCEERARKEAEEKKKAESPAEEISKVEKGENE